MMNWLLKASLVTSTTHVYVVPPVSLGQPCHLYYTCLCRPTSVPGSALSPLLHMFMSSHQCLWVNPVTSTTHVYVVPPVSLGQPCHLYYTCLCRPTSVPGSTMSPLLHMLMSSHQCPWVSLVTSTTHVYVVPPVSLGQPCHLYYTCLCRPTSVPGSALSPLLHVFMSSHQCPWVSLVTSTTRVYVVPPVSLGQPCHLYYTCLCRPTSVPGSALSPLLHMFMSSHQCPWVSLVTSTTRVYVVPPVSLGQPCHLYYTCLCRPTSVHGSALSPLLHMFMSSHQCPWVSLVTSTTHVYVVPPVSMGQPCHLYYTCLCRPTSVHGSALSPLLHMFMSSHQCPWVSLVTSTTRVYVVPPVSMCQPCHLYYTCLCRPTSVPGSALSPLLHMFMSSHQCPWVSLVTSTTHVYVVPPVSMGQPCHLYYTCLCRPTSVHGSALSPLLHMFMSSHQCPWVSLVTSTTHVYVVPPVSLGQPCHLYYTCLCRPTSVPGSTLSPLLHMFMSSHQCLWVSLVTSTTHVYVVPPVSLGQPCHLYYTCLCRPTSVPGSALSPLLHMFMSSHQCPWVNLVTSTTHVYVVPPVSLGQPCHLYYTCLCRPTSVPGSARSCASLPCLLRRAGPTEDAKCATRGQCTVPSATTNATPAASP